MTARLGGFLLLPDESAPRGRIWGSEAGIHAHPLDVLAHEYRGDPHGNLDAVLEWVVQRAETRADDAIAKLNAASSAERVAAMALATAGRLPWLELSTADEGGEEFGALVRHTVALDPGNRCPHRWQVDIIPAVLDLPPLLQARCTRCGRFASGDLTAAADPIPTRKKRFR